jgi:hypothetical protein
VPHELKDGDIVQLGIDYQGGMEDISKSVKIRIEVGCDLQEDDEETRRRRLFTLSETQVCSLPLFLPLFVQSNIALGGDIQPRSQSELSSDHDSTNTHSQESHQGPSSYSSFDVSCLASMYMLNASILDADPDSCDSRRTDGSRLTHR